MACAGTRLPFTGGLTMKDHENGHMAVDTFDLSQAPMGVGPGSRGPLEVKPTSSIGDGPESATSSFLPPSVPSPETPARAVSITLMLGTVLGWFSSLARWIKGMAPNVPPENLPSSTSGGPQSDPFAIPNPALGLFYALLWAGATAASAVLSYSAVLAIFPADEFGEIDLGSVGTVSMASVISCFFCAVIVGVGVLIDRSAREINAGPAIRSRPEGSKASDDTQDAGKPGSPGRKATRAALIIFGGLLILTSASMAAVRTYYLRDERLELGDILLYGAVALLTAVLETALLALSGPAFHGFLVPVANRFIRYVENHWSFVSFLVRLVLGVAGFLGLAALYLGLLLLRMVEVFPRIFWDSSVSAYGWARTSFANWRDRSARNRKDRDRGKADASVQHQQLITTRDQKIAQEKATQLETKLRARSERARLKAEAEQARRELQELKRKNRRK